ncbi:MAG: phasin family protein [Acidimicrobiales bacterium]
MPENDLIRRSLDLGMAVTQLTRQRAEQLVRDLVRAGEVSREQATSRVEELLERSRQNSEALIAIVRGEIDSRVAQLNLVSRDDLAALAGRIGIPLPAARKATKKAGAKKAAKKAGAKKAPAKKAAPKKTAAKKAPAKKAPAKKAAAKKAPAKSQAVARPAEQTTPLWGESTGAPRTL